MRVIVDAFGGDNAPLEIIKGAAEAAAEYKVGISLAGREAEIRRVAGENGISLAGEDLFVCQSLADLGLTPPEEDLCPPVIHTGERIGIAYAQEAVHFPWRFYL